MSSGDATARPAWVLGALVATFAAIRLAACFGDLWLDEIWSLDDAVVLASPAEVLTRLHIDNNHPLNTLWLAALGAGRPDWAYRLFAWLTGAAAVGLAGLVAAREQQLDAEAATTAAVFAVLLTGGSYLLVHYATEARGYAPALAFSLLAYFAVLRGVDADRSAWAPVYWLAAALALLAHATAVHAVAGVGVWTAVRWWRRSGPRGLRGRLAWWHAAPLAFGVGYWWIFLRHLAIGGGPLRSLADRLGAAAAYALGLPVAAAYPALAASAVVTALGLLGLARRGNDRWIVYAVAVVASPAALLAITRHELIFERYFLVSFGFLLLLGAGLLAGLWQAGGWRRVAAAGLVAFFLAGNAVHTARLLRLGRGAYSEALATIAARSPGPTITIASDHDFRNGKVFAYHVRRIAAGTELRYLSADAWPPEGPDWLLLHRQDEATLPSDAVVAGDVLFRLEATYPYAAMSGWTWFVLRNAGPVVP